VLVLEHFLRSSVGKFEVGIDLQENLQEREEIVALKNTLGGLQRL
jgi:hypothetical protein